MSVRCRRVALPAEHQFLVRLLDGHTACFSLPASSSLDDLHAHIERSYGIPTSLQRLICSTRLLHSASYHDDEHDGELSTLLSSIHIDLNEPFTCLTLLLALPGGKGGFGSLLRATTARVGVKRTSDFSAMRDLHGRRMRHVEQDKELQRWEDDMAGKSEAEKKAMRQQIRDKMTRIKRGQRVEDRKPCRWGAQCKYKYKCKGSHPDDGDDEKQQADGGRMAVLGAASWQAAVVDEEEIMEDLQTAMRKKKKHHEEKEGKERDDEDDEQEEGDDDDDDEDEDSAMEQSEDERKEGPSRSRRSVWDDELLLDDEDDEDASKEDDSKGEAMARRKGHPEAEEKEEKDDQTKRNRRGRVSHEGEEQEEQAQPSGGQQRQNKAPLEEKEEKEERKELPAVEQEKQEDRAGQRSSQPTSSSSSSSSSSSASSCATTSSSPTAPTTTAPVTAAVPSAASTASSAYPAIDLSKHDTDASLHNYGMEHLRHELDRVGLKCGGTLAERAERLFMLKTHTLQQMPKKMLKQSQR